MLALTEAASRKPRTLRQYIERTAPQHTPIPWHLLRLVDLFDRALRQPTYALVAMPPRHAKTTTVRRALAYAIGRYPDRLNGFAQYSADAAAFHSMQIREQARNDGIVLAEDAQKVGLWLTPKRGGLFAAGIGGAWTGKGIGGLVIVDDPLKDREEAESFTLRNKAYETITNSVFTRLEPPCGSFVLVATRWHEDDPTGRLLEKSGKDGFPHFEQIVLPALRDPITNEPSDNDDAIALWPERFPRETLVATRAVLGPYGWASLYQGTPRPRGGHVFKREPARFVVGDDGRHIAGRRLLLSLDAAGTESTRSDYSVCGALAFDGDGESMTCNVVDMLRMQLEPQDSAPRIAEFAARWGNPLLVIEKSRDGVAIARALERIAPQLRFELVPPIGDKFTRAQPVAAAWNATPPRVAVPIDASWVADMLHEFSKFTGMGDKHDDIVDMLSQGWNFITEPRQQFRDDDEYVL